MSKIKSLLALSMMIFSFSAFADETLRISISDQWIANQFKSSDVTFPKLNWLDLDLSPKTMQSNCSTVVLKKGPNDSFPVWSKTWTVNSTKLSIVQKATFSIKIESSNGTYAVSTDIEANGQMIHHFFYLNSDAAPELNVGPEYEIEAKGLSNGFDKARVVPVLVVGRCY